MKRDMDLVREILFELEKQDGSGSRMRVVLEGRSEDEINYHLLLLKDAGVLEAAVLRDGVRAISPVTELVVVEEG